MNNGIDTPKISPKLLELGSAVNPFAITLDEMKLYPWTFYPAAKAEFKAVFMLLTAADELADTVPLTMVDPLRVLRIMKCRS
jgi:hypothetical protein